MRDCNEGKRTGSEPTWPSDLYTGVERRGALGETRLWCRVKLPGHASLFTKGSTAAKRLGPSSNFAVQLPEREQ